jgi:hypothetical protein
MPATQIDQSDAQELVEILQLLTDWITTDPGRLNTSLTRFVGNPAYGTSQLSEDLHRFTFLLGGNNDGTGLFTPNLS